MKIILICVVSRTIALCDVKDPFNDGKRICNFDTAAVGIDFERDSLMVDDEGLLKAKNPAFKITVPGLEVGSYQDMFCGSAFIMGHDHEKDENLDCSFSVQDVEKMVEWTNKVAIG